MRRCTTIANVRPNECKCIQCKPAHTSWTVAGQRGELEDLLPLGLGVALTRTKVSLALAPCCFLFPSHWPFWAAASLQVNSRFVLSFLITQRIHQSAHHLSLAKMGTTLSCLISSKQKEEKIANDRKHKQHKKKETACTQTFVLHVCMWFFILLYLFVFSWSSENKALMGNIWTTHCLLLVHSSLFHSNYQEQEAAVGVVCTRPGAHDRETLSRSHRWDLNWGWRHLIGWQLRSSGPVLHCISSVGAGGAEAVMASSLPFSAC